MNKKTLLCALSAFFLAASITSAAEPALQDGDHVAVCGDSITEQKIYSVFIEDYLVMCQPKAKLSVVQFGWGGETSWGFLSRVNNDVLRVKFDVATTFYGMNDGGYAPLEPGRAKQYREAQSRVVDAFKKAGVQTIVLGSPGCVDSFYFRNSAKEAGIYDKTLGELRDIDREIAKEKGVVFADVHQTMLDAMVKAKEKFGEKYEFAGKDGVHPGEPGHLVIAYAFLKALGCDGDIGTITIDLAANKADASTGHKIVSHDGGKFEIESTRYPFCFNEQTRKIAGIFPFNDDLNRLKLVVTGANSQMKVTWGDESKEFSAEALAKGINLAAEFVNSPFSKSFAVVEEKIRQEQNDQTSLMRELVHNVPHLEELLPEQKAALESLAKSAFEKNHAKAQAVVDAVTPVRHTIVIEPVKN
jgi:lysophospholipase L1-like esterase